MPLISADQFNPREESLHGAEVDHEHLPLALLAGIGVDRSVSTAQVRREQNRADHQQNTVDTDHAEVSACV